MLVNLIQTESNLSVTGAVTVPAYDMTNISTLSAQCFLDVNTPAAETFLQDNVNITANTFPTLLTAFPLGLKVRATSTGTLPTGITTGVDYFVIPVTANTIQLATTWANAVAGTAIDITATGTAAATGTLTPTSIAGGTIAFQMSNVTVNHAASTTATDWTDIETATAVTVDATVWYNLIGPTFRWFRVKPVVTAGSVAAEIHVLGRGENKN